MEIKRLTPDSPPEIFGEMSALDKACVGADGWSAKSFAEEAANPGAIVLAAYHDGAFAGLFAGFTASGTGEVLTVAVSPDFRRKGIARAMLTRFFELVPPDTETVALEVRQSNTAAIRLYESFGFVKAGVRKRFYREPTEDADIMVKNMKESDT